MLGQPQGGRGCRMHHDQRALPVPMPPTRPPCEAGVDRPLYGLGYGGSERSPGLLNDSKSRAGTR